MIVEERTSLGTTWLVGHSRERIGWDVCSVCSTLCMPVASITSWAFYVSRCDGAFFSVRCDFEHVVYGSRRRPILISSISERKRGNEDSDYSSGTNGSQLSAMRSLETLTSISWLSHQRETGPRREGNCSICCEYSES